MKTKFISVFLLLSSFAIQAQEKKVKLVQTKSICFYDDVPIMWSTKIKSLFSKQDADSEIVAQIKENDEVVILDEKYKKNGWLYVCSNGVEGWITLSGLSNTPPK